MYSVSQSRAIIDRFCQDEGFELTYYIETLAEIKVLFIFPFKTVVKSESFILGLSTFQQLIVFTLFFSENTGKLQVHHIHVPNPFILGSSGDLHCNYSWTHPEQESRPIYSIKWYKENAEFFR